MNPLMHVSNKIGIVAMIIGCFFDISYNYNITVTVGAAEDREKDVPQAMAEYFLKILGST
jgi:amino acid permease